MEWLHQVRYDAILHYNFARNVLQFSSIVRNETGDWHMSITKLFFNSLANWVAYITQLNEKGYYPQQMVFHFVKCGLQL